MDQDLVATVAGARRALGNAGEPKGARSGETPRYELFHAANSICSQKVRVVLAYHAMPYVSHGLNLAIGQTYLPGYVRLRMLGCEHYGGALVSHHTGSTSAASHGCDGAVVPTLVDWGTGEVIVDSHRICLHLDSQVPAEDRLRPAPLAASIDDDLVVIDNMANYQMLMGRTVTSAGPSTATLTDVGGAFSRRKVAWCTKYLEEYGDDPVLAAAYTAKRAKELSAADELFSLQAMQTAYDRAEAGLVTLERKLEGRGTRWLYHDRLTLADLFWGLQLSRMKNVGVARFWTAGRLPEVERFSDATEEIPAIRTAVIDWPGAMF
jgi:2,5-dichlorohydroquinone reductive dechlorinase